MDGGAWWATVLGVAKSRTRLSDFTSLTESPYINILCFKIRRQRHSKWGLALNAG